MTPSIANDERHIRTAKIMLRKRFIAKYPPLVDVLPELFLKDISSEFVLNYGLKTEITV